MTKAEAQKEFKSKWIAYGMRLFTRAEAHGVDWRKLSPSKLEAEILFAEEFAMPDEYKNNPFSITQ
jgi:hypothetical protein